MRYPTVVPDHRQRRSSPIPRERAEGGPVDDATVERLRAGDRAAFEAIYEAYRARLYSFLLRLAQDEQLARDLSQETWMRLAANARRLSPSTAVGAWLFTVARNLFASHRRWALVDRNSLPLMSWLTENRGRPSPLEELSAGILERRLEHALAALRPRYREVLLLVHVEGFSTAEVASMLDLEPATVRQRLARGRAQLKRTLDADLDLGERK